MHVIKRYQINGTRSVRLEIFNRKISFMNSFKTTMFNFRMVPDLNSIACIGVTLGGLIHEDFHCPCYLPVILFDPEGEGSKGSKIMR
jgi:hypothetical protein